MGIAEAFSRDDRFEIKTESFIKMAQEAAKAEAKVVFLMNAVNCNVPYRFIRETMTGVSEEKEISGEHEDNGAETAELNEPTGYPELDEPYED